MAVLDTTVITFYTPGGEYKQRAAVIGEQCKRMGIRFLSKEWPAPEPPLEQYLGACRMKPHFILYAMMRLQSPVLWIDADAELRKDPRDALQEDMDFMAGRMPLTRDRTWHVGTLFFNNTWPAKALVALWIQHLDNETSDEAALERAWRTGEWNGRAAALPRSYHWCRGKVWLRKENQQLRDDTVILHNLSKSPEKASMLAKMRAATRAVAAKTDTTPKEILF